MTELMIDRKRLLFTKNTLLFNTIRNQRVKTKKLKKLEN